MIQYFACIKHERLRVPYMSLDRADSNMHLAFAHQFNVYGTRSKGLYIIIYSLVECLGEAYYISFSITFEIE